MPRTLLLALLFLGLPAHAGASDMTVPTVAFALSARSAHVDRCGGRSPEAAVRAVLDALGLSIGDFTEADGVHHGLYEAESRRWEASFERLDQAPLCRVAAAVDVEAFGDPPPLRVPPEDGEHPPEP